MKIVSFILTSVRTAPPVFVLNELWNLASLNSLRECVFPSSCQDVEIKGCDWSFARVRFRS